MRAADSGLRIASTHSIRNPQSAIISSSGAIRTRILAQKLTVMHVDGLVARIGQKVREAFERDCQFNVFDLDSGSRIEVYGGKIEHGADPGVSDLFENLLGRGRGHGDDHDLDGFAPDNLADVPRVLNLQSGACFLPCLLRINVE